MFSIAAQLESVVGDDTPTWTKTKDGFAFSRYGAELVRREGPRGRARWFLVLNKKEYELGRRASFDHAERLIAVHARASSMPSLLAKR